MAECWFCKTAKGKRYCPSIENILCPVCCGENRLIKIDCSGDCRYLEGVVYQQKREEEKAFSNLLAAVPHGQFDDIFQEPAVAPITYEIETFVRDAYLSGRMVITDKIVYESYKDIYERYFGAQSPEALLSERFSQELEKFYLDHRRSWKSKMTHEKIGQIFLRLMISVKKMSGGRFGEFGYLNYLKNNLGNIDLDGHFIAEDKFGNKLLQKSKKF